MSMCYYCVVCVAVLVSSWLSGLDTVCMDMLNQMVCDLVIQFSRRAGVCLSVSQNCCVCVCACVCACVCVRVCACV